MKKPINYVFGIGAASQVGNSKTALTQVAQRFQKYTELNVQNICYNLPKIIPTSPMGPH